MLFSKLASSFFIFGLATTTFASPVAEPQPEPDVAAAALALRTRQVSESSVEAVFTTLQSTLNPLISQISTRAFFPLSSLFLSPDNTIADNPPTP